MAKGQKQQKRLPFNVQGNLSKDNGSLLIVADLKVDPARKTKNGKACLVASTQSPVRVVHPTIPGLYYMVKVVQRLNADPPELALLREQQAAVKAKIKAYREQQKARKAAK